MWSIMISAFGMQNRKSFISLGQLFHGGIISFHYCTRQLCSFSCSLFWVFETTAILNWYFSLATLPLMENGNVLSRIFLSRQNLPKAAMIVQFSQILYLSHPTIWKFSHYYYKDWDSCKVFFISPSLGKGRWGIEPHKKGNREKRRKEKSKQLKESKKQNQG